MKKTIVLTGIFLLLATSSRAQWRHSDTDGVNSLNWGIIGMIKFKRVNDTLMRPLYSDEVKRFNDRKFKLTGYMVPIKAGRKHTRFMISTLPINQCFFCGKNGNPIMVIVEAAQPVPLSFKLITVEGILTLKEENAFYSPPVYLYSASLVN